MTETIPLPPTPMLETARLILRPLEERDIPAVQRIFPQWEVVRHLRAAFPWPLPAEAIAANMAQSLEQLARREKFGWAITLKGSDELRGFIELEPDDGKSQDMRGFWLDPELQRRGLMTEAADAVTRYAFETLGWPHLYLNNALANVASARIKARQGAVEIRREPMIYVAGPDERQVWLLTREAWQARRAPVLPPTPVLETARLVLRPLEARDAPAIQRLFGQWEVVRFLLAKTPWPYPADGAATNMAECLEKRARNEQLFWAITLKGGDDELVGRIDLRPDAGDHEMRGFWLDPQLAGAGLMTEAAEAVTAYAFEVLGWPHIWVSNAASNRGSHRIKEKQGFELMAVDRALFVFGEDDRELWRLTREDWFARKGN